MTHAVVARDVSYAVGPHRLVDRISLEIESGELVAIVGPNGAGKSTLLQLLAGELRPSEGSIQIDGRPLAGLSAREAALARAVMPQDTTLQFAFKAESVVAMGRHPHRAGRPADTTAVAAAMRDAGILHLADRSYPTLSGGERQRVTFARVLAQESPILLLDEPTTSLDLHHQEHLMSHARALVDDGRTVVAVLHDLNLAAAYADRLCLLHLGRLVAAGPPAELLVAAPLDRVFEHPLSITVDPETGIPAVNPRRGARR